MKKQLSAGAEEYKILLRKYAAALERTMELINHHEEESNTSTTILSDKTDFDVHQCPLCYWEFPHHLTLDGKKEHIERHFQ